VGRELPSLLIEEKSSHRGMLDSGGYLDWGVGGPGWDGEGSARWDGEGDTGWDGEGGDWGAGHSHGHGRVSVTAVSGRRGHRSRVHSSSGASDWWRGSGPGVGLHRVGLVEERQHGAGGGHAARVWWRRVVTRGRDRAANVEHEVGGGEWWCRLG
jgi:hypothetical protein